MERRGDIRTEVVGREEELASIGRFVDGHDFPRVLVLEGEAGIGKTTLWRAGVVTAERAGYRVLASRPAGAEVRLSFAALSDLLEGHLEEVLPALPGPQRRALEVVLLLADDDGRPPDERAIAVAVLNAVRALAREAPLLVAIDDAQWLDVPSASAIEYTARRLRAEQVAMLVSSRTEIAPSPPLDLERALAQDRFTRIQVGPLSLGAIHRVVTEGAGISVNRPTLLRIHETSGGNPFYARELARTLASGAHRTGEPLAISASLNELLGNRLSQFSDPTADALAVAAAASEPTLELVGAVLDAPAEEVLEPAVRAGVVRVAGGRIEFTHPLLASAAYAVSGERDRHHWHARLADSSADLEERARHRALAAAGPDADVAALLHDAGRQARSRGAPAAAAELLEHAIALTPDEQPQVRAARTVDAASTMVDVGDRERARRLLEGALPTIEPGPVRGDALLLLSDLVEDDVDGADRQLALIGQSLLEPGADDRRRAEALLKRELHMRSQDQLQEALDASREALALAEATEDGQLRVRALTRVLDLEVVLGVAADASSHFRRALALEQGRPIDPYMGPPAMLALCLIRKGEVDDARPLLLRQYRRANEEGNEPARGYLCLHLAELEWLAGHWDDALRNCQEGIEIAEQIDSRLLYGSILGVLGLIEAGRGEVAEARQHGTDGLELCESIGERAYAIQARCTLGFLDLSLGDAAAAREHLSGFSVERGVEGSKRITFIADAIEALVLLGKLDRAAALVDELDRRADGLHRPSLVALAGRCRGLLSGARGDPEGATATLQRAIEEFRMLNLPFERGRTLLVLGLTQRRAKRKRPAREALEAALAIFESLGAPLWAKTARSEMARIGGRRTARGLTPTERRVAELVAAGHSNKQVAAELFVSVRAVEANLTRIYAKLGIRSRTELGACL